MAGVSVQRVRRAVIARPRGVLCDDFEHTVRLVEAVAREARTLFG